jgi:hypothetical protein
MQDLTIGLFGFSTPLKQGVNQINCCSEKNPGDALARYDN